MTELPENTNSMTHITVRTMNLADVIQLRKDNQAVNWKATGQVVRDHVLKTYPNNRPSEQTMIASALHENIRKRWAKLVYINHGTAGAIQAMIEYRNRKEATNGSR